MMTRMLTAVSLTLLFSMPAWAQRDGKPPRDGAAKLCLARIAYATTRTVRGIDAITDRCESMIVRLVQADQKEEAMALAERCTAAIRELAAAGADRVDQIARYCSPSLTAVSPGEVPDPVIQRAVIAAKGLIGDALDRGMRRIAAALEG